MSATPTPGIKPRVAYLSDDAELVQVIQSNLDHAFDVIGVTDVADLDAALAALRRIRPKFVLLDPDMPGLDRQTLHRHIKSDAQLAQIQILVISEDMT